MMSAGSDSVIEMPREFTVIFVRQSSRRLPLLIAA